MKYEQRRWFSPVPAAFAVLASVGTLALAVIAPATIAACDAESSLVARDSIPVVHYRIDVVGVREALVTDVHVKETARKSS